MDYCTVCGKGLGEWESGYYLGSRVCYDCYVTDFSGKTEICTGCGLRLNKRDADYSFGTTLCQVCMDKRKKQLALETCAKCGKRIEGKHYVTPHGEHLCSDCFQTVARFGSVGMKSCSRCGKEATYRFIDSRGHAMCSACASKASGPLRREREVTDIVEEPPAITRLRGIIERILKR